jgi:hypothetical protein
LLITPLLQQALIAVSALPAEDQDVWAARLLDDLAAEEAFDQKLADTGGRLNALANEALADFRAGALYRLTRTGCELADDQQESVILKSVVPKLSVVTTRLAKRPALL